MKEIVRINHLGLRVRDLDTARGFYEKLGFEFLAGPLGPEPVAVMEHPSGININFILNASPDASPVNLLMDVAAKHTGYTHVALQIQSVEAAEALMDQLGVAITGRHSFKGINTIFIRDPDRNVIELVEHSGPNFFTEVHSSQHV